jgi:hypothetical protein
MKPEPEHVTPSDPGGFHHTTEESENSRRQSNIKNDLIELA